MSMLFILQRGLGNCSWQFWQRLGTGRLNGCDLRALQSPVGDFFDLPEGDADRQRVGGDLNRRC